MLGPPNMASTVARFSYPRRIWNYVDKAETTPGGERRNVLVPTEDTIRIHMHPASGATVKRLSEGQEVADFQTGYTSGNVRVMDPVTGVRGVPVEPEGKIYEAIEQGDWTSGNTGATTWRQFHFARVLDRNVP